MIASGDLKGNRFTIALRLASPITPSLKTEMEEKIAEARQDGFWNFFYLQRFGTPRLIAHRLGRLLLLGNYEAVVTMFLTHVGERELPYFTAIRGAISEKVGDWRSIEELMRPFPYHFNLERTLVGYLITHPKDFLGALRMLPDQVRLWMYAYDSFLFNRKLSELIRLGDVPLWLPFATSFKPVDWKPYEKFLEEDGVKLPSMSYRDFPFIRVESRKCATLQPIEIHAATFEERSAIFSFSLPKGSYATSFLTGFLPLLPDCLLCREYIPIRSMGERLPGERVSRRCSIVLKQCSTAIRRIFKVIYWKNRDIKMKKPDKRKRESGFGVTSFQGDGSW